MTNPFYLTMKYNPIQIAESKLGFQKCHPYTSFNDHTPRWLKGGGLWDSADVIAFVEYKMLFDKTL